MKSIKYTSVLALTTALLSTSALAAGYQLNEYSATGMGRSFAGMGVVGDDFSALGYNPAGMVFNKTNGMQIGASWVRLHSTFKGTADGGATYGRGQTDINRVLPSGFVQYKVNDKLTAGLGVYVPFGLATDYKNGWFGETHGGLSQITNLNVSPAFSYQVNDVFAIGGSVNFQHAKARLTSSSSDVSGSDWATGYTVGITLKPIQNWRIGMSYRSKVSHKLKGDYEYYHPIAGRLEGDVSAKITTPETAILSMAYDLTDKWTLSGTARWTRWKRFDDLDIILESPVSRTSTTHEKWRNTGFYALGADYKANENWTLRGGLGYDMTVIRSSNYRTPRIPDGRRAWFSLGTSYAYKNMQFDLGYAHIFVYGGHAKGTDNVSGATYGKPDIKYSSDANMLSLMAQYKF